MSLEFYVVYVKHFPFALSISFKDEIKLPRLSHIMYSIIYLEYLIESATERNVNSVD